MLIKVMKRLIILSSMFLFLSGCYQASLGPVMNVAGPAAGAAQGRAISSTLSTGISYGIKHKTGKYPIEHILKREKDKIVNKVASLGDDAVKTSTFIKEKVVKSTENFNNKKDNLKIKSREKARKLRWVLHIKEIKSVKQEEAFPANKPRYSYWSE